MYSDMQECVKETIVASVDDRQHDRNVLARLVTYAIADIEASQQELDLHTNEELPRVIPLLCTYFSREALTQLVGEQRATQMYALYRTEALQNIFLEAELQHLLQAFNNAHIPLLLMKGPALAYTVYPEAHLRSYHDIDALIHPEDMTKAHELLTSMGYSFYEEYRANTLDKARTGYNFLLKRPDSWLEVLVELHTAPHPSEIGTQFDVAALWSHAQAIVIQGEHALTFAPVDHLLYLCWHYRFHSFTRLLWLYDLVMVIRHGIATNTLDWNELIRQARQLQLASTLYYCLSWCRSLFSVAVPAWVLQQLYPPLLIRVAIERFALPEPARMLAVARFQGRRTLARRAMVDSIGEVFIALFRTLFPSQATLGRRYLDNSRLPLQLSFLFYLIHPWVTVFKGSAYLFKRRKRAA